MTFHLHKLKAAGDDLADVLYWARAGFAAVAVICEALIDLRPVDYLVPLASARAAAQAADLLDQVAATPPPPSRRPDHPIPVPTLGGGPELLVPRDRSPAAVALAARPLRIADGVMELAAAIRGSLRVAGKSPAAGDRRAIGGRSARRSCAPG